MQILIVCYLEKDLAGNVDQLKVIQGLDNQNHLWKKYNNDDINNNIKNPKVFVYGCTIEVETITVQHFYGNEEYHGIFVV